MKSREASFWTKTVAAAAIGATVITGCGTGVSQRPEKSPSVSAKATSPSSHTGSGSKTPTKESSSSAETVQPHTYTLDQSTVAEYSLDALQVQQLQNKLNLMSKTGVMGYATSGNPNELVKGYTTSLEDSFDKADATIAGCMIWNPALEANVNNFIENHAMKPFQGSNPSPQVMAHGYKFVYTISTPKEVPASGPYMFGDRDYSNLAVPPYSVTSYSTDTNTGKQVPEKIMIAANTSAKLVERALTTQQVPVQISDDAVYTFEPFAATDQTTGEETTIWMATDVDSFHTPN